MYRFFKILFICFKIKFSARVFSILVLWKSHTLPPISFFHPDAVGIIVTCFKTMFVCFKIKCQYGFGTNNERNEKTCFKAFTLHN